jgi:hypothetical protein
MFRVDATKTIFRVRVYSPDRSIALEKDWLGRSVQTTG